MGHGWRRQRYRHRQAGGGYCKGEFTHDFRSSSKYQWKRRLLAAVSLT
jgi:hypothetical protein